MAGRMLHMIDLRGWTAGLNKVRLICACLAEAEDFLTCEELVVQRASRLLAIRSGTLNE